MAWSFVLSCLACLSADSAAMAAIPVERSVVGRGGDEWELVAAALACDQALADGERRRLAGSLGAWVETYAVGERQTASTESGRLERLFSAFHRDILHGGYRAEASEIAETLRTGEYNCLSATILFVDVARRLGWNVRPIARGAHVLCEVEAPSGNDRSAAWVRVELTCPRWFVLSSAERAECAAKDGGGGDGEWRRLSDAQLLALVYFNRGTAHLARQHFAAAAEANRTAWKLDPSSPMIRENLVATLNNWAVACCQAGDYRAAWTLLAGATAVQPEHPSVTANRRYVERHLQP